MGEVLVNINNIETVTNMTTQVLDAGYSPESCPGEGYLRHLKNILFVNSFSIKDQAKRFEVAHSCLKSRKKRPRVTPFRKSKGIKARFMPFPRSRAHRAPDAFRAIKRLPPH